MRTVLQGVVTAAAMTFAVPAFASTGSSWIPQIQPLVKVNLRNVLNHLAVDLKIDKANVPVTIQLPVQVAANVCGVSVNVLSVSTGGKAQCTAKSAPMELTQAVQQQMAAGGSVGAGSAQIGGNSSTGNINSTGTATSKTATGSKSG